MRLTVDRAALLAAVQVADDLVPTRTVNPVLANLKLTADDAAGTLVVQANDLDRGVRIGLAAAVLSGGECLLPADRLGAILKACGDETVAIAATGAGTHVTTAAGWYDLPGGDPGQFPDVPEFGDPDAYHDVDAGVLRTLIQRTVFAAKKKETTRYAVTGVLWEVEAGRVRLVATDAKLLAVANGPAEVVGDVGPEHHLVPRKAVELLDKLLADGGRVRVCLRPNMALFQTERAVLHTQLLEGRFPDWRSVLPESHAVSLVVPVAEFLERVTQAAVTTDEAKRLDIRIEGGGA